MALQKTISLTDNFGIEVSFSDAYIRVDQLEGSKDSISIFVVTRDKQGGRVLATRHHDFQPDLDGDNFIKQAYEHLKALPEFADAIDC
jgi:hypothetical protein